MRFILPLLLLLAACGGAPAPAEPPAAEKAAPQQLAQIPIFPPPDRPVAAISGSGAWSDEDSRDDSREAERVFKLLGIRPGLTVADIGAGSGYYTVRLAPALAPGGRVIANDVIPDYVKRLQQRTQAKGLTNIEFVLGDSGNANLPRESVDIALMVHMYHEIADPFSLLWHLHESLKPGETAQSQAQSPGGLVAIIDADRPTSRHGTPPDLLKCELKATGYRQIAFHRLENNSYLAIFEPESRPDPAKIQPCKTPRT
ncbi:class I SAM-dependent methyltransferase [Sandaracinobacter sp. RS1-74]|uniref:class I SAM-dependent methyltransferase n=1 Tax=Sandaracinobacteroides sayramensis TaxID=2913411 RepID=UPI001ED9D0CA|nr:class I SAM-dependent methyltransferase [Sandaracinobacteroides sayramensis]MCG2841846.1 class I SAM-dependent methyltransferase [Sandaracinobacteroides sayramensis]